MAKIGARRSNPYLKGNRAPVRAPICGDIR